MTTIHIKIQGRRNQAGGGGMPTSAPPLQFLADQLTLYQPGHRADYAHHITTCPLGFSALLIALYIYTTSFFFSACFTA